MLICMGATNIFDFAKLILILLCVFSTHIIKAQKLGMDFSAGYQIKPIAKVDIQYKIKNHAIIGNYIINMTNKSNVPQAIGSINYGYSFHNFQPYVGYSTEGLSYGINKYFSNTMVIGIGTTGDYKHVTLGITSFNIKKDNFFTNNDIAIAGTSFAAGYFRGWHESIQAGHWGKGNKFWDNEISWKNKYKNYDAGDTRAKFLGSKSIFVFTTDGYHFTAFLQHSAEIATLSFAIGSKEKVTPKMIAKKLGISLISNGVGFILSYDVLYK